MNPKSLFNESDIESWSEDLMSMYGCLSAHELHWEHFGKLYSFFCGIVINGISLLIYIIRLLPTHLVSVSGPKPASGHVPAAGKGLV